MTDSRINPAKPWTNSIVPLPVVDLALSEGERTPPLSPLNAPHLSLCLLSSEVLHFPSYQGGNTVNLPPFGAARTRSTATATADATEVAPILVASLR